VTQQPVDRDEAPSGYVPPAVDPRARREAFALVLMALGLVGLVTVAFLVHPLAGAATVSAVVFVGGVLLALDR
jgi:hypothetical protein